MNNNSDIQVRYVLVQVAATHHLLASSEARHDACTAQERQRFGTGVAKKREFNPSECTVPPVQICYINGSSRENDWDHYLGWGLGLSGRDHNKGSRAYEWGSKYLHQPHSSLICSFAWTLTKPVRKIAE